VEKTSKCPQVLADFSEFDSPLEAALDQDTIKELEDEVLGMLELSNSCCLLLWCFRHADKNISDHHQNKSSILGVGRARVQQKKLKVCLLPESLSCTTHLKRSLLKLPARTCNGGVVVQATIHKQLAALQKRAGIKD
jgi:hypothetical protein